MTGFELQPQRHFEQFSLRSQPQWIYYFVVFAPHKGTPSFERDRWAAVRARRKRDDFRPGRSFSASLLRTLTSPFIAVIETRRVLSFFSFCLFVLFRVLTFFPPPGRYHHPKRAAEASVCCRTLRIFSNCGFRSFAA